MYIKFYFHTRSVNACFTVHTDENLALNKPASQVNTYMNRVASLAVDGRQDTHSCTNSAVHPWLSVDLGAAYYVSHVTVTNDIGAAVGNYSSILLCSLTKITYTVNGRDCR